MLKRRKEELGVDQEDPTPMIASRIERWMADTGTQLFRDVFDQEARVIFGPHWHRNLAKRGLRSIPT